MDTLTRSYRGGLLRGGWTVESVRSPDPSYLVAETRGCPLTDDALDALIDVIVAYYRRPGVRRAIRQYKRPGNWPLEPGFRVGPFGCELLVLNEDREELVEAVNAIVSNEDNHELDRLGM